MRRREFLGVVGGAAAALPLAARAQQPTPTVGFLTSLSAGERAHNAEAFRQGLNEIGYVEGRNATIEYRYADHQMDRLRPLAADLIARKVGVIAAVGGNNTALVAKALTSTIPILFTSGVDPVQAGLVSSLNRPEANVTGVSWFTAELGQKHIELLLEIIPAAALIAVLVDPKNPESGYYERSVSEGARTLGRRLLILQAGTASEIDAAFATLAGQRANAVIVTAGPFYATRAPQLAVLAARHGVPLLASNRDLPAAGALISYGNNVNDAYRRVGILAGRVLKGAKPADLPIERALKFELVINLATSRALGLAIPPSLVARADEVIE